MEFSAGAPQYPVNIRLGEGAVVLDLAATAPGRIRIAAQGPDGVVTTGAVDADDLRRQLETMMDPFGAAGRLQVIAAEPSDRLGFVDWQGSSTVIRFRPAGSNIDGEVSRRVAVDGLLRVWRAAAPGDVPPSVPQAPPKKPRTVARAVDPRDERPAAGGWLGTPDDAGR